MYKKLLLVIFFLLFLLSITNPLNLSYAQSSEELDQQLREKKQQIKDLENQLSQAQTQEKTLKSQLNYIDNQTKLTQLKIEETEFQITKLDKEINDLGNRINRISGTLDQISQVLLTRIVETYKTGNISTLDLIFSSRGIGDLIKKVKYVEVAQANDKKVLYQLQATKATYNDQKQDKETRQAQQQKLQKDLEQFTNQLAKQKQAKQELLKATQNDETKFQQLLAKLRADADSISRALAGKGVTLGPVSKGQRIASVGNSGCSTGPHLHFEVMTPAHIENGAIVGKQNKVDPKPFLDSGKFAKPLSSYNGGDCSQGGDCHAGDITTRFGQVYFLGSHTGLDIADYSGSSIYAAENGESYAFADSQACYLTGTVGKGVAIDHHNGIVTLYWHIP